MGGGPGKDPYSVTLNMSYDTVEQTGHEYEDVTVRKISTGGYYEEIGSTQQAFVLTQSPAYAPTVIKED